MSSSKRTQTAFATALVPILLAALTLSSSPISGAATSSGSTTSAEETTRADLGTFMQGLKDALNASASNPATKAYIAPKAQDQLAALSSAQATLPQLTGPQLDAIAVALGKTSNWKQEPAGLKDAVNSISTTAGPRISPHIAPFAVANPGFLSNCTNGAAEFSDIRGIFYAAWAAAQVASAANAVASGMPDGADFAPAVIIAGIAFGVANGIAIGLNFQLSQESDCQSAFGNGTIISTYPMDGGSIVPGSSQISVDTLKTIADGVKSTIDSIQTLENTITSKLANVINVLGTDQGTANNILATTTDLQSRTDALLATVGTPADTGTTTAHGLINTINTRMDTILTNTANLQTLDVRMQIERALAAPSPVPVLTLFALPAAQGGFLETVRDITTKTLAAETAAGQGIGQAQIFLSRGNDAFNAGQFEAAYKQYQQAYITAVR